MAQAGSSRANFPALCPLGFGCLQGRRCHSYGGQPVPVLHHPNSEFLSYARMEFSTFRFVPPVLSLDITEESLVPSSLNLPRALTDIA